MKPKNYTFLAADKESARRWSLLKLRGIKQLQESPNPYVRKYIEQLEKNIYKNGLK